MLKELKQKANRSRKANKKSAIVISAYDYYDVRAKYFVEFLEGEGYEVDYLIASFNHYTKGKQKKREGATLIKTIGYKRNVSAKRLLSCLMFSAGVNRKIIKEKPQVVYSIIPPNSICLFTGKTKQKLGYRLILDIIDSWPESFSFNNKALKLLSLPFFCIWRNMRNSYITLADTVIGVSETALGVVPPGEYKRMLLYPMPRRNAEIDLSAFKNTETIKFCYLGGINKLLNMDRIVGLLSAINKNRRAELHIIGNGEKKPEFIDRLTSEGVAVVDHGEIYKWEEKFKIYSACSFGINVPKSEAKVTMSLKGAEYFCASLPVINEAFGDTEKLVKQYKAGINTRNISLEKAAKIIADLKYEEIVEYKNNAYVLYKEEFETKLSKELLF